jgi:hypothetical protein
VRDSFTHNAVRPVNSNALIVPRIACAKHGASFEDFKTLTARYSGDGFNRRVVVTVRDRVGRCYVMNTSARLRDISRLLTTWAGSERSAAGVRRLQDVSQQPSLKR